MSRVGAEAGDDAATTAMTASTIHSNAFAARATATSTFATNGDTQPRYSPLLHHDASATATAAWTSTPAAGPQHDDWLTSSLPVDQAAAAGRAAVKRYTRTSSGRDASATRLAYLAVAADALTGAAAADGSAASGLRAACTVAEARRRLRRVTQHALAGDVARSRRAASSMDPEGMCGASPIAGRLSAVTDADIRRYLRLADERVVQRRASGAKYVLDVRALLAHHQSTCPRCTPRNVGPTCLTARFIAAVLGGGVDLSWFAKSSDEWRRFARRRTEAPAIEPKTSAERETLRKGLASAVNDGALTYDIPVHGSEGRHVMSRFVVHRYCLPQMGLPDEDDDLFSHDWDAYIDQHSGGAGAAAVSDVGKAAEGKPRVVVNAKAALNDQLQSWSLVYPTLEDAVVGLTPRSFQWVVDVKSGFFHVPMATRSQMYLGVRDLDGRVMYFEAMPFGLNIAPGIFCTLSGELARIASVRWERASIHASITVFVDDFHSAAESSDHAHEALSDFKALTADVGVELSASKEQPPQGTVRYLGFRASAPDMSISVAEDKLRAMVAELHLMRAFEQRKERVPVSMLGRVAGRLTWAAPALEYARAHIAPLWSLRALARRKRWSHVAVTNEAKQCVDWWLERMPALVERGGTRLLPHLRAGGRAHATIFTDASGEVGCGAVIRCWPQQRAAATPASAEAAAGAGAGAGAGPDEAPVQWTIAHTWAGDDRRRYVESDTATSTEFELHGLLLALQSLLSAGDSVGRESLKLPADAVILAAIDNAGAVFALNRGNSIHQPSRALVQRIHTLCRARRVHLLVWWLPRELLEVPDALSKHRLAPSQTIPTSGCAEPSVP